MSKSSNVQGGITEHIGKDGDKAPGPGHYFKDGAIEKFVKNVKGGTFSRLTRDKGTSKKDQTPSVGQYSINVEKTTLGGLMSRRDRVCAFAKMAERANLWNSNGPGKYDAVVPEKKTRAPSFHAPISESRVPKKGSGVGPGYYTPNFNQIDFRPPAFSGCKEETGAFLARAIKERSATPFPWYKDMPDSVQHDKKGLRKHTKTLLHDRQVTPRRKPGNSLAAPQNIPFLDLAIAERSGTPQPQRPTPRRTPCNSGRNSGRNSARYGASSPQNVPTAEADTADRQTHTPRPPALPPRQGTPHNSGRNSAMYGASSPQNVPAVVLDT